MAASLITVLFLFVCQLQSASADLLMTAHTGDDVTLPCDAPNNVNIAAVEWTRSDPDAKKCVFLKRDGHLVTADQDPSYENRTQLKDDKMTNGDLSLRLKNVNNNDNGRYECLYVVKRGRRSKRAVIDGKLISIVQLKVAGPTGRGYAGVLLPVVLIVLIVSGLVGLVIYKKRKGRSENNSDLPDDDPGVLQKLQENENSQHITHNISAIQV